MWTSLINIWLAITGGLPANAPAVQANDPEVNLELEGVQRSEPDQGTIAAWLDCMGYESIEITPGDDLHITTVVLDNSAGPVNITAEHARMKECFERHDFFSSIDLDLRRPDIENPRHVELEGLDGSSASEDQFRDDRVIISVDRKVWGLPTISPTRRNRWKYGNPRKEYKRKRPGQFGYEMFF